jgi:small-conductance mechanosensitive channel
MLKGLLDKTFYQNTLEQYLTSIALFAVGVLLVRLIKGIFIHRLKVRAEKTQTTIDDFLVGMGKSKLLPVLYFGVFYISIQNLLLGPGLTKAVNVAGVVILTFMGISLSVAVVRYGFEQYCFRKEEEASKKDSFRRLLPVVKFLIWSLGVVFLLDNLGFEISTLLAGLGIGGIAFALASQAILGDLFSYFSILIDRPFELGDFIIIGDYMGTVENIGVKTTRIRSLGGEQLVFSNNDLTNSRVRNYKRMEQRRVVFRLGVVYQTGLEMLRKVPEIIKNAIEGVEDTWFDRAHFFSFGDSSLDFEAVYYVLSSDYNKYMDVQQAINFAIKEEFEKLGIEFAYPTRTLYMERG